MSLMSEQAAASASTRAIPDGKKKHAKKTAAANGSARKAVSASASKPANGVVKPKSKKEKKQHSKIDSAASVQPEEQHTRQQRNSQNKPQRLTARSGDADTAERDPLSGRSIQVHTHRRPPSRAAALHDQSWSALDSGSTLPPLISSEKGSGLSSRHLDPHPAPCRDRCMRLTAAAVAIVCVCDTSAPAATQPPHSATHQRHRDYSFDCAPRARDAPLLH